MGPLTGYQVQEFLSKLSDEDLNRPIYYCGDADVNFYANTISVEEITLGRPKKKVKVIHFNQIWKEGCNVS